MDSINLPVIHELLKGDCSQAAHFGDGTPGGCPGWHVIHGPILTYGRGDAPSTLQSWAMENALLAHVGPTAAKAFDRPMLNGVKLVFGFGDGIVSEVRVNGAYDKAASNYPVVSACHKPSSVSSSLTPTCGALLKQPDN